MINTEIKEVSLYRSGCFISREGTVTLKAGKHHVEIATGSNALDTSTVRLALPEEVTGSNVQVELLSNDQMKEQTRELNEKLSRLDEKILLTYYVTGFPVDCVHAAATWIFLWFGAEPMLEKLDRIKVKYGLVE